MTVIGDGGSGGGDPVFHAFHSGHKFHWQGKPKRVFAVLSDANLQFNAHLIKNDGHDGGTWMDQFAFVAHNATLVRVKKLYVCIALLTCVNATGHFCQ